MHARPVDANITVGTLYTTVLRPNYLAFNDNLFTDWRNGVIHAHFVDSLYIVTLCWSSSAMLL